MTRLHILACLTVALAACADLDADTARRLPQYGSAYGFYLDATNSTLDTYYNGTEVSTINGSGNVTFLGTLAATGAQTFTGDATFNGAAGAVTLGASGTIVGENAETLDNATDGEWCLNGGGGTNNEDICLDLETTANVAAWTTNTAVATMDLGAIDVDLGGGAAALQFTDSASSITVIDADASALDIGSTGLLNGLRYDSTNDAENVVYTAGLSGAAVSITGVITLDYSNCGKSHFVTAGIDTASITLPPLATVTTGCELTFFYVGADGGALLDISPAAADGVEGTCTLAASIVTLSGTDDADVGLTKATGLQGDSITLVAGNADDWYVKACSGIWANN